MFPFCSAVTDRSLFELKKLLTITALVWKAKGHFAWKPPLWRKSRIGLIQQRARERYYAVMTDIFVIYLTATHTDSVHSDGALMILVYFFTVFALFCAFFPNLKHFCVCCSQLRFQMEMTIHSPCCHRLLSCVFCSRMSHKICTLYTR